MQDVILRVEGLFSKWGFVDGDALDDFLYDGGLFELEPNNWQHELAEFGFAHALLIRIVETKLLPLLPRKIETRRISTHHNPIRAWGEGGPEEFEGIYAVVSFADVEAIAHELLK